MAIKDQCYICKKKDTEECPGVNEYDGISCSSYSKGISLEKIESKTEEINKGTSSNGSSPFVVTGENLKKTTEIHGWLTFFLFAIIIGGLVSFIYPIATYNPSDYEGSEILAWGDIVLGLMLLALSVYTVYSFYQRKPNAVFLGKTYVVAVFATNLLSLFGGDFESSGLGSMPQIIRSLIWAIIWFSYLSLSPQVEEVIPKPYRKLANSDYYIIFALIIVPLAFIGWGIKEMVSTNAPEVSTYYEETKLQDGEYTDGKIIFSAPHDFKCEMNETNSLKVFTIENDEIGTITMCSDYDSDQSDKNINSYWSNWEDEDAATYDKEIVINVKRVVNGYNYFYKTTRYDINDNVLFWRFIMLFDNASSKVCVISAYDGGYDDYIDELLRNIRFR